MVDLHVHTTFSDGQYTPREVIDKAIKLGLAAIAITDHDSTQGIEEARKAIDDTFKKGDALTFSSPINEAIDSVAVTPIKKIELIPGIELNIEWPHGECHLLGLGLKCTSKKLETVIDTLRLLRIERNKEIIQKLCDNGIHITLDDVEQDLNSTRNTPADLISRVHIAHYLTTHKYVHSKKVAFEKYLSNNGLCYVRKRGVDLESAIDAITQSLGIPVIAHPMSLYLSRTHLKEKLQEFFEKGVKGLEAFHPSAKLGDCQWLESTARSIGYFITAGSDFHGEEVRADRFLGHTVGGAEIDDKYYFSELLPALNKLG